MHCNNYLRLVLGLGFVRVSSRVRVRIRVKVRASVMVRVSIRTSWVVNFAIFRCYRPVIHTRPGNEYKLMILIIKLTSPSGADANYCDEYVCLCVCLSVRISPQSHARSLPIFLHVAYVHGSVLLRHINDRPHRLWAGRGDGSAQRGRTVIYDCLVRLGVARSWS